ncbi:MAG: tail fiber domain-containing protein [Nitrospirae bacterium]|nr:tail fiber domain-containing protein [Nitrospirota bacterium]
MKTIKGLAVSLITAFLLMQSVPGYSLIQHFGAISSTNPGSLSGITTDNVTEGASNAYYTNARARAALSASGPLSYSSSTGAFSLGTVPITSGGTGSVATPVRGQMLIGNDNGTFKLNTLTAGSNVTITKDNGSVTIAASTGGAPTWGNIAGTLSNQTDLQTALNVKEPAITAGTSSQWWNGTKNWVSLYSDNLTEGAANLFYTNARARGALSSSGLITYNAGTGAIGNYTIYADNITQGTTNIFETASTSGYWRNGTNHWFTLYMDNITQGTTNKFITASTSGNWLNGTTNWFALYPDNLTGSHLGDIFYDNGTAVKRLVPSAGVLTNNGTAAPVWTSTTGSGSVVRALIPTIGDGTGVQTLYINGGNTNNGDGSRLVFQNGGVAYFEIGNQDAILGGTYTNLPMLYSGNGLNMQLNGNLTMEASGGGYYNQASHAWVNGSSIRWKTNIDNLTDGLETMNCLQPRSYNFDNTHGGQPSIGFVAEEAMQCGKVSTLVDIDTDNTSYANGLNYGNLSAVIVQAIKEQNAQSQGVLEAFNGALTRYDSVFVIPEDVQLDNTTARVGVINGGLQLAPGTQIQPACDDAHRGTHWFVAVSDNSTDYEEVCAYVSGVLGWRKITWQ